MLKINLRKKTENDIRLHNDIIKNTIFEILKNSEENKDIITEYLHFLEFDSNTKLNENHFPNLLFTSNLDMLSIYNEWKMDKTNPIWNDFTNLGIHRDEIINLTTFKKYVNFTKANTNEIGILVGNISLSKDSLPKLCYKILGNYINVLGSKSMIDSFTVLQNIDNLLPYISDEVKSDMFELLAYKKYKK